MTVLSLLLLSPLSQKEDDEVEFDLGDDSTDDDIDVPAAPQAGGRGKGPAAAADDDDDDDDGVLSDSEDDEEEAAKEDMWAAPRAGKFAANVAAMVRAWGSPQSQALTPLSAH